MNEENRKKLANPNNWEYIYDESTHTWCWAYVGPWKLAEKEEN